MRRRRRRSFYLTSIPQFIASFLFLPLATPDSIAEERWGRNRTDTFILKKLDDSNLKPSPRADDRVLVRRLYLQLIGVTPTENELQNALNNPADERLDGLTDGLLKDPRFGQHWGRHWLDVARYADAKGYVDAGEPKFAFAYTYRDYVVNAFNEDMPYPQFIREQIAADRLPNADDPRSLAALGFLTVGSRFNLNPHDTIDDQIDVVTRGFLGKTVSCARCHDHKYDPISAEDYYSLYGIFANSKEPTADQLPVIESDTSEPNPEFDAELSKRVTAYHDLRNKYYQDIQRDLRQDAGDYLRYIVQTHPQHRTEEQPKIRNETGLLRTKSAYAHGAVIRWKRFLNDQGPDDPIFGLWSRVVRLATKRIQIQFQEQFDEWRALNPNRFVESAFANASIHSMLDVANIYAEIIESVESEWANIQRADPRASRLEDPSREAVRQVLYTPNAPASVTIDESEDIYLLDESSSTRSKFADIERQFLEHWDTVAPRAMVLTERPSPKPAKVFTRGDPTRLGVPAPRTIPPIITGGAPVPIESGSGRLELANAIAEENLAHATRVMANRVWAWLFGAGLVATPSDFGAQGAEPSHPELLEYLAGYLHDHDGSIKALIRLIVSSSAWRQSSAARPDAMNIDPENRLIWRMSRQSLSLEAMRDSLLQVAGRLDTSLGGLPVEAALDDPDNTRRTLYTFVDREHLQDLYRVFDFPSPEISADQRSQTTVPQQALFLLNSPFVSAQAKHIADRLQNESNGSWTNEQLIQKLFGAVLGRSPTPEESRDCATFLKVRQSPSAPTELAQTLLLSNEFLFIE